MLLESYKLDLASLCYFHSCTVLATIKNNQGYPVTECTFPNTPEVSQITVAFSMLSLEAFLANLELP